ncbi:MAG: molybdopterin cofactor-binding domain-containing protein [Thalassovita sp.]
MLHADNAYYLPHVRIESHRLRTNTQSATAYRGFGGPQGMVGIERVMDHVAHDLGMDPVALRQRNYYDAVEGARPLPQAFRGKMKDNCTPYGQPVEDFVLHGLTAHCWTAWITPRGGRRWTRNAGEPGKQESGLGFSPVKFGISFALRRI